MEGWKIGGDGTLPSILPFLINASCSDLTHQICEMLWNLRFIPISEFRLNAPADLANADPESARSPGQLSRGQSRFRSLGSQGVRLESG
jgi:hypothetical protein